MASRNKLQLAPPHPVEAALRGLGENLRTARLRRNLTIADAAARIGTGPRAVMDAEKGKASTGIVVYAALLWLYDLLAPFEDVADPSSDREGLSRESARARRRARKRGDLDREF